jgi:hypothetical protein
LNPLEKDLVRYRLERAREALDEARLLFEKAHLNASVSRVYYACFYAVGALLLCKGLSAHRHGGVRTLFHQALVKPGLVSRASSEYYDEVLEERMRGDYGDFSEFQKSQVKEWLDKAPGFLDEIEKAASRLMSS